MLSITTNTFHFYYHSLYPPNTIKHHQVFCARPRQSKGTVRDLQPEPDTHPYSLTVRSTIFHIAASVSAIMTNRTPDAREHKHLVTPSPTPSRDVLPQPLASRGRKYRNYEDYFYTSQEGYSFLDQNPAQVGFLSFSNNSRPVFLTLHLAGHSIFDTRTSGLFPLCAGPSGNNSDAASLSRSHPRWIAYALFQSRQSKQRGAYVCTSSAKGGQRI